MRVRSRECVSWEPGGTTASVGTGPFGEDELLRMAELTRDFHPVRLVLRVAKDAGYAGLLLHPAWISGLADAGIRAAFPCGRVKSLSVSHHHIAVHTDILSLHMVAAEHHDSTEGASVSFVVKNQKGILVARGEARMSLHPPSQIRNVSRETFGTIL